jgi:hypothetical protein
MVTAVRRGWALIFVVTVLAYLPTLRNGFVWDDDTFLTDNRLIKAPDGLQRFWLTTEPPDYWPVTSTTLWAEWRLWGLHPAGYHLTNLLLHVAEAGLLWSILRRLRVPGALLAALLFAVHPVNVESVAWIAQRKNLMAMLFFLLALEGFLRTRWWREGDLARTVADPAYGLSLAAFVLAMLSKGSVAMLPVVLLGLIAWRRRPGWGDGARLAPFFAVAAGLAAVNVWFAAHGAKGVVRAAGFAERLLGAGAVVWFYLGKALWPARLIFVYPQWQIDPRSVAWWLPGVAVLAVSAGLWRWARPRGLFFAWAYFVVMLVPVMGFTDVYFMKYSLVADHYQHLAIISVAATVAAGVAGIAHRWSRAAAWVLGAVLVGTLGTLTWRQCRMYRDSETLYRTLLAENPNAWMAHNNLVNILVGSNRLPEAVVELREALRLQPDAENENNLGVALVRLGRPAEAVPHYQAAVRLRPGYPEFLYNLGLALTQTGQAEAALGPLAEVVRRLPQFPGGHFALAAALRQTGQAEAAEAERAAARRLQGDAPP